MYSTNIQALHYPKEMGYTALYWDSLNYSEILCGNILLFGYHAMPDGEVILKLFRSTFLFRFKIMDTFFDDPIHILINCTVETFLEIYVFNH